uniref:Vitamin K-dependent protein C n=1 Tax=Strigamia maritima TaxID=126957 RepID=T1IVS7_STRMM
MKPKTFVSLVVRAFQLPNILGSRSPGFTYVLLGTDYAMPHDIFKVIELIYHSRYEAEFFLNDIGLIKLRDAVTFNEFMKPPCFPRPNLNYDGQLARVAGWGRVFEGGSQSDLLMKVDLPILSLKECKNAYGVNIIQSSFICAGFNEGGKDSCEGDSGGSLVWQNQSRWYLIGLVSWGIGCARPNSPAPYTRVDKYYDWLDQHMPNVTFLFIIFLIFKAKIFSALDVEKRQLNNQEFNLYEQLTWYLQNLPTFSCTQK